MRDVTRAVSWCVPALVLAMAGTSYAKEKVVRVRGNAATVKKAIDRARPGTRILLKSPLTGDVNLGTNRVTLDLNGTELHGSVEVKGNSAGVINGTVLGDVTVRADSVTIRDVTVVEGAIRGVGDAILVEDCTVESAPSDGAAISLSGDEVAAYGNTVAHASIGVLLAGDDAHAVSNQVSDCTDGGIRVEDGTGAVVESNEVSGIGMWGIAVKGDDVQVAYNDVSDSVGGVRCEGTSLVVSSNEIEVASSPGGERCPGILVLDPDATGASAIIDRNAVTATGTMAICMIADSGNVWRNVVRPISGAVGIDVVGDSTYVSANTVIASGEPLANEVVDGILTAAPSDAIRVTGDWNNVRGNGASGWPELCAGIRVQGFGNETTDNLLHDAAGSGIVVVGASSISTDDSCQDLGGDAVVVSGDVNLVSGLAASDIDGCGALLYGAQNGLRNCNFEDCAMGGVMNSGTQTDLVTCTFDNNRPVDVVNDGSLRMVMLRTAITFDGDQGTLGPNANVRVVGEGVLQIWTPAPID